MVACGAGHAGLTGRRVGPWLLVERLGSSTWRGIDATGASVVVRAAPPGTPAARAVGAEAAALGALGSLHLPGLVRPAGEVAAPGLHAVATVALAGPTLAELLLAKQPMQWPEAAALLIPVVDAVAAVHAAGWVHGDVAATNVVVTVAGAVLVDLGCARRVEEARATGTPGTVAPEVVAGRPVTPAAEVWSLAALATALVRSDGRVPVPAEATVALRAALSADPGARPTAAQLAATLRLGAGEAEPCDLRAVTTVDFGPRPPAPVRPPAAPARRWMVGAPVGLVALALAVAWSGEDPAAVASPRPTSCPVAPAGAHLVADPDGDGCDVSATWSGGVLTIVLHPGSPPTRVAVGAPGDAVVLGDWDCDGRDTPGAYRPTTGVVTLWDDWPTSRPAADVAPTAIRADRFGGAAAVSADAAGCDHVVVTPPGSVPPDG